MVGRVYHYTAEGLIDWKAEVDPRFLYVPRELEAKVVQLTGKPLAEVDLKTLPEHLVRIKIGGLNQLAHLRGVRSCTYPILQTRDSFAAAVCEIEFIANCESDGYPETWSAMASASPLSMDLKMRPYMETFAENRSFGRTIKRALQIGWLTDIEVGGDGREAAVDDGKQETALAEQAPAGGFDPCEELTKVCRNHRDIRGAATPISFETLKAAAIKLNAENPPSTDPAKPATRTQADPTTWATFKDIQPIDAWLLLGKIREKEEAAKVLIGLGETPKARKGKQP